MTLPYSNQTTSRAAAEAALPRAGTHRRLALDTIDAAGREGLTDEQLAWALRGRVAENGVRARRGELATLGLIVKQGTRKTRSGCDADVWVARRHAQVQLELVP